MLSTVNLGYIGSKILVRYEQPLIPRITLPPTRPGRVPTTGYGTDPADHLNSTMKAFPIVGKYLTERLTEEIRKNTHPAVFNKYKDARTIGTTLKSQLVQYTYQSPPFNTVTETEPRLYWAALTANPKAEVLAVSHSCIF
jgi:hypothetical protein